MAHELESGVFVGQPAWHGLGVVLPKSKGLDSGEALRLAKLGEWDLQKIKLIAEWPDGEQVVMDEHAAIGRGIDRRVFAPVGKDYTLVPNEQSFEWMDYLLGGEGFHYQTAGSLRGGRIVWLLAKAPFAIDLPDSKIDMFVLLTNAHDGSAAVQAAITPIRVVCMNTLTAALGEAQRRGHTKRGEDGTVSSAHFVKIRHTVNAADKLAEAQKVLGLTKGAMARVKSRAEEMRKDKITDASFRAFLDKLVPLPEDEGAARTIAQNTQSTIRAIYSDDPTQKAIKNTAWGAFNAVVAFNDHVVGGRNTEVASAEENRMIRLMLRDSARGLTQRAMALLSH